MTNIPWGLPARANKVAAFNQDRGLYRTENFLSDSPRWERVGLEVLGLNEEPLEFVEDALSPYYLGTGAEINGWILTEGFVYRIQDIFGSPSLTLQKALGSYTQWRTMDFGFFAGEPPRGVIVSHLRNGAGVYVSYTRDGGQTWSDETRVGTGTPSIISYDEVFEPGLYVSNKTPGLVFIRAWAGSNPPRTQMFVSFNDGQDFAPREALPNPGDYPNLICQADIPDGDTRDAIGVIHIPWAGNEDEQFAYALGTIEFNFFPPAKQRLYRVQGDMQTVLTVDYSEPFHLAPFRGRWGISTSSENRNKVAATIYHEAAAVPQHRLAVSEDGGNSWTVYNFEPGEEDKVLRVAIAKDDDNVCYILGKEGHIWYSDDFCQTLSSRRGDLPGYLDKEFIGLAAVPLLDAPEHDGEPDCSFDYAAEGGQNSFATVGGPTGVSGQGPLSWWSGMGAGAILGSLGDGFEALRALGRTMDFSSALSLWDGEKRFQFPLLEQLAPSGALNFTPIFRQSMLDDAVFQIMGPGWTHNHAVRLKMSDTFANVFLDNGGVLQLHQDTPTRFTAAAGSNAVLEQVGALWKLTAPAGNTFTFALPWTPTDGQGYPLGHTFYRLESRTWSNGDTWRYSYASDVSQSETSHRLTRVADDFGHELQFVYDALTTPAHRLLSVNDAAGNAIVLTYAKKEMLGGIEYGARRSLLTDVSGTGFSRQFKYYGQQAAETNDHIRNFVTEVTQGYWEEGLWQETTLEALAYTVSDTGEVEGITQVMGEGLLTREYSFGLIDADERRYTKEVTAGAENTAVYHYFEHGMSAGAKDGENNQYSLIINRNTFRAQEYADGNGNRTLFTWSDDSEHLTQITQAAGESEQNTSTFDYVDYRLASQVAADNRKTTYVYDDLYRQPTLVLVGPEVGQPIIAGDMESGWNTLGAQTINELVSTHVNSGDYARYVKADGLDQGIESVTWTLPPDQTYTLRARVFVVKGGVQMQVPGIAGCNVQSEGTGTWETLQVIYEHTGGPVTPTLQFVASTLDNGEAEFYVDDVEVRVAGDINIEGDMDTVASDGVWSNVGAVGRNQRVHSPFKGQFCRHIVTGSANEGVESAAWEVQAGIIYRITAKVYPVNCTVNMQVPGVAGFSAQTTGTGAWEPLTIFSTAGSSQPEAHLQFIALESNAEFYIDSVSIEGILDDDMEAASGWTGVGAPPINELTVKATGGQFSRHVITTAADEGVQSTNWNLIANQVYTIRAHVYPVGGVGSEMAEMRLIGESGIIVDSLQRELRDSTRGQDTWETLSFVYKPNADTNNVRLQFLSKGGLAEFYVDSVSVQLSRELPLNGDMEAESGWTGIVNHPPVTHERRLRADTGTAFRHITALALNDGLQSANWSLVEGHTYLAMARVFAEKGKARMQVPGLVASEAETAAAGQWETLRAVFQHTGSTESKTLQVVASFLVDNEAEFYVDTVHVIDLGAIGTNRKDQLYWQEYAYDSKQRVVAERNIDPENAKAVREVTRSYHAVGDGNGLLKRIDRYDVQAGTSIYTEFFYDAAGRVIQTRDSSTLGSCTASYTLYDSGGKVLAAICNYDPGLHAAPRTTLEAEALYNSDRPDKNHVTTYVYDDAERLKGMTSKAGSDHPQTIRFVYDALGRAIRTIVNFVPQFDALGREIATEDWSWDEASQSWKGTVTQDPPTVTVIGHGMENNQNIISETDYNDLGLVRRQRDVLGRVTLHGYDRAGRLVRTVENATVPSHNNNFVVGANPDPSLAAYPKDDTRWDADIVSIYTYDAVGNLVSQLASAADGNNRDTVTTYDPLNRPIRALQNPSNPAYGFQDDPYLDNYSYSVQPDEDLLTKLEYDAAGRIVRSRQLLDHRGLVDQWEVTLYGYDPLGRQVKVIRSASDAAYNVENDPDLSEYIASDEADRDIVTTAVWNSAGPVRYAADAIGSKTWFVYDGLERPKKHIANCSYLSGTPAPEDDAYRGDKDDPAEDIITEVIYDYDGRVQKTKRVLAYDYYGEFASLLWTLYGYDEAGRAARVIHSASNPDYNITADPDLSDYVASASPEEDRITDTAYDVQGRVQKTTDPRGNVTLYGYDSVGRPVKTIQNASNPAYNVDGDPDLSDYVPAGNPGTDQDLVATAEFDILGRVAKAVDEMALETRYMYDELGRLTRIVANYVAQGDSDPAAWVWNDAAGHLRWEQSLSNDTPIDHGANNDRNLITDIRVDKLDQVESTRDARGTKTAFVYDGAGRRRQIRQASQTTLATTTYVCYDKGGRVLRRIEHWIPALDQNGEPISPDAQDDNGQWIFNPGPDDPKFSDQNRIIEYRYDAAGRPHTVIDEVRNETRLSYTKDGLLETATNPAGWVTRYTYDGLRRLVQVTQNEASDLYKLVWSGEYAVYAMDLGDPSPTLLADNIPFAYEASWSPDGNWIVFAAGDPGETQIYVMKADGTEQTQLTDTGENVGPVWSPDSIRIAFVSWRDGIGKAIYVIDRGGSNLTRVTSGEPALNDWPAWSPDGTKIAFVSRRVEGSVQVEEIYVTDADGINETRLTDGGLATSRPAWSPDGSKVAFSYMGSGLHVVNADGSGQTPLPGGGFYPQWSPDGSKIASRATFLVSPLLVVNADGTGAIQLEPVAGFWWRTSDRIWFTPGFESGIFAIDADGSNRMQISRVGYLAAPPVPTVNGVNDDKNVPVIVTYDKAGNRYSVEGPVERSRRSTHDKLGRRTTLNLESVGDPIQWSFSYADVGGGLRVLTADPDYHQTERNFDRMGRLASIHYLNETPKRTPDVTFTYDPAGNLTRMVENDGTQDVRITNYAYDAARRLIAAGFDRDGSGSAPEQTVRYQHDVGGLRTRLTLPATPTDLEIAYAYDVRGRLRRLTDWATPNRYTDYTYDHADRLVAAETPADHLLSRYTYDAAGALQSVQHKQSQDDLMLAQFMYRTDPLGNRTQVREFVTHPATTEDRTYRYDDASIQYQGSWYDGPTYKSSSASMKVASAQLAFYGRAATLTAGTGQDCGYFDIYINNTFWRSFNGYSPVEGDLVIPLPLEGDGPHVVEMRSAGRRDPAASLYSYALRFKQLVVQDMTYEMHTVDYAYDALSRVIQARYNPGINSEAPGSALLRRDRYTYDLVGNRLLQQSWLNGVLDRERVAYFYDYANRLLGFMGGVPFNYSDSGNLLNDEVFTYTWDRANRLTEVYNPATQQTFAYAYNGLGQRVQSAASGVTTDYLLDVAAPLELVLAATAGGDTTRVVFDPLGLQSQQSPAGAWTRLLPDGLGSVRAELDSSLVPQAWRHFSPYGEPFGAQGTFATPFGFTGEPTDPTGLVHLRARTYHPTLGFFLSLDPVEGVPAVPMSLHGYSYAHGNPVTWTDPSGEILPLVLGGLIIAGIAGAGYNLFATQGVGLGGRNQFNLGCVDWKQVGLSGLFMAPLGAAIGLAPLYAFGGGAITVGIGALTGRYASEGWAERLGMDLYAGLFSGGIGGGFGKLFGPTLAPTMDFLGDVGSGTLVDTLLYGDSFEDALVFNALTAGAFQVGSGLFGGWGKRPSTWDRPEFELRKGKSRFRFWEDGIGVTTTDLDPQERPWWRRWPKYISRITENDNLPGSPGWIDTQAHETVHVLVSEHLPIYRAATFKTVGGIPVGAIPKYIEETIAYGVGHTAARRLHAIPFAPIEALGSLNDAERNFIYLSLFAGIGGIIAYEK